MGRIDILVSQIGSLFQTCSVADEGLKGRVSLWVYTIYECPLLEKNRIQCGRSHDRTFEELILPSQ